MTRNSPPMKRCWTFFLVSGVSPAWKRSASSPHGLQEIGDLLGVPPRRAVDDGAAAIVRGQVRLYDPVDVGGLSLAARQRHHEVQVGSPCAAVEDLQLDIELLAKVVLYLPLDVGLGGRCQTEHRWWRVALRSFADEPPHVAVVGAEVVPPLREAVSLVQNPGADLPLLEDAAHRDAAKLLRRDDEDAGVAEPNPVKGIGPLGHGQEAVDGDAGADAPRLEPGHLV